MANRTVGAYAMVAVQALLFLLIVVAALAPDLGPAVWVSLPVSIGLILIGALAMLWSGRDLGESLTALPVPNGRGLAAKGIYRYARHPMYSAVVVVCLGVAVGAGKIQVYAVVVALAIFFEFKTRAEERHLVQVYDGYAEYAARTGKFLPGIGKRH